jgi:membrane protease YdiL (CAAX protease family)
MDKNELNSNNINKSKIRIWIVLLSPIIIMILGNIAARLFTNFLGKWAWIGYFLVYWAMLFIFMRFSGKRKDQLSWFRKPKGSILWVFLALVIGMISFPALFIPNFNVIQSVSLVVALCVFSLINASFEEAYWRGFLLDETAHLPRVFGVLYSTVLFTAIHPLNLGVFSKIQAFDPTRPMALVPFLIILIVLSLVYSLLYLKTKSLRLPILSHLLTDIGNLSIFLFMNMVHL